MKKIAAFALLGALVSWSAAAQMSAGWTPDLIPTPAVSCSAVCTTPFVSTQGAAVVSVQATGSATGMTFSFQGTNDGGATWQTLPGVVMGATTAAVVSASADGIWIVPVAGFQRMRVNLTAISGGTETFTLEATTRPNQAAMMAVMTLAAGGTVAANQGTASASESWLVNLNKIAGAALTLGQKVMATSIPVVLPSDQSALNVLLQTGSAIAGRLGTDLTTPGTTNLVSAGLAQQVASDPTVQNASYVSGNCIGGFNAVTVTANNGQSGFVINFRVISIGGSVPAVTLYLFDSNPSASTCTDKSTFTLNSADVDKMLVTPLAATLAVPIGTTTSFAAFDFPSARPFIAGGATNSGVKTIYYALVSGSTFTPAATTDIHTRVGVLLN